MRGDSINNRPQDTLAASVRRWSRKAPSPRAEACSVRRKAVCCPQRGPLGGKHARGLGTSRGPGLPTVRAPMSTTQEHGCVAQARLTPPFLTATASGESHHVCLRNSFPQLHQTPSKLGLPVIFYHGTQVFTLCPMLHASFIFMQAIIHLKLFC